MPQMKPLLWFNLYLYMLGMFILFFVMMNYLFIYKNSKNDLLSENKKFSLVTFKKWLW
uniref:ATP synthase F0 subunit 8 n=1 Tax=Platyscapa corneri TaxID=130029 RepID=A0A8A9Y5A7_9HYME|nr:ATP synthase F0 subunit 8 [Platyscapa corneri]